MAETATTDSLRERLEGIVEGIPHALNVEQQDPRMVALVACESLRAILAERGIPVADVLMRLMLETRSSGGMREFARQHHLSAAYVSDVLAGKREPGAKILNAIGMEKRVERVVSYYATEDAACAHSYEANPGMYDTMQRYCRKCGMAE